MAAFRGSCLCGDVAFEIEGPFDRFLNCHCAIPDRHVQWTSRAEWYVHGDGLPVED